jgi:nucleoside-diphosphate-sugar epimerase
MRVGITGGTGFIGSPLVRRHLERGDHVRILSRGTRDRSGLPQGVDVAVGDLTGPDAPLERFADGLDVLYHCAGELRNEARMHQLHVNGTRALVNAAAGHIGRWVQLSSVGVYGSHRTGVVREETAPNPRGTYEITKSVSDEIVLAAAREGKLVATVLRPSIVFGAGMPNQSIYQMVGMIDRGLFFFIGKPGASANYVEVTNVVDALVLCATREEAKGRVYNLSDWCTLEVFVDTIADALHRRSPRIRVPEKPVRLLAKTLGRVHRMPLTESRVDALSSRARYANDRLERELGFEHSVRIAAGLRHLVETRGAA